MSSQRGGAGQRQQRYQRLLLTYGWVVAAPGLRRDESALDHIRGRWSLKTLQLRIKLISIPLHRNSLAVVTLPFFSFLFSFVLLPSPLLGLWAADGGGSVLCAGRFNVSSKYRSRWRVCGEDLNRRPETRRWEDDCRREPHVPRWTTSLPHPAMSPAPPCSHVMTKCDSPLQGMGRESY